MKKEKKIVGTVEYYLVGKNSDGCLWLGKEYLLGDMAIVNDEFELFTSAYTTNFMDRYYPFEGCDTVCGEDDMWKLCELLEQYAFYVRCVYDFRQGHCFVSGHVWESRKRPEWSDEIQNVFIPEVVNEIYKLLEPEETNE